MHLTPRLSTSLELACCFPAGNLMPFGKSENEHSALNFSDFPHGYPTTLLISLYLHTPFAHLICSTLLHSASNSAGEATRMQIHLARLVATFRRLGLKIKFNPRGASWTVEAARE